MHMNDVSTTNVSDTGACKGKSGYYALAKEALNKLSDEERAELVNDAYFADAYARLQVWATANGETLSIDTSGAVSYSNAVMTASPRGSYIGTLAAIICLTALASLSVVYLLRRKKRSLNI